MSGFYLWSMRVAPAILFAIAIIVFVATIFIGIAALSALDQSPYAVGEPVVSLGVVVRSFGPRRNAIAAQILRSA